MDRMKEMARSMDIDGDGVITIEEYFTSCPSVDDGARAKKPVT
ncbi:MAG: hypothetical protein PHT96_08600 [Syntrophorhabdaceae bacterium]|nr:hypothetical protein [Syntrophorhabdaceae bacterium]HOC46041.1 hypothetical protein [Syntrophorhabdaceae bacterium]